MSAALPTTELYAFAQPILKGDELGIAVRVSGGLHALKASRSVWRDLHEKLGSALGVAVAPAAPIARSRRSYHVLRPRLSAETHAACRAATTAWLDGKFTKQREAAEAHGIGYSTLVNWLRDHRGEFPERSREPITKPNGEIL